MTQTPASFPIHGNAAAEHWAKEARKWHELTMVAVLLALLMMFVFSVAMAVALDHAHDAANRAAQSAKEARQSADAAWWKERPGSVMPTSPVRFPYRISMMQCDAEKCEVR